MRKFYDHLGYDRSTKKIRAREMPPKETVKTILGAESDTPGGRGKRRRRRCFVSNLLCVYYMTKLCVSFLQERTVNVERPFNSVLYGATSRSSGLSKRPILDQR